MSSRTATRLLFILLISVEVVGWMGFLPWTPTYSWVGMIITALAVWGFVEWFNLPDRLWPLFFAGLLLDAVADTFQFYYHLDQWDRLMHLIGGALAAIAAWHTLKPVFAAGLALRWRIFLTLALVALFGTFYEGMELGVDMFYAAVEGQPRGALGDGVDTVDDLLLNLIGGLAAVGIAEYRRRR